MVCTKTFVLFKACIIPFGCQNVRKKVLYELMTECVLILTYLRFGAEGADVAPTLVFSYENELSNLFSVYGLGV